MAPTAAMRARRGIPWLIVAGVLVAALSLRGPIIAPTPVLRDIENDLGIGAATAGLLTSAPVLMFALVTPLAALVIRRAGPEVALMASLCGVLLGTLVRALPGFGSVITGMLLIGAAATIGNVVIPVIIRRDVPPERVSIITASYTAALNAGSLITALLTAPLAGLIGWNLALLVWGTLSLSGVILWGVHLRRDRFAAERSSGAPVGMVSEAPRRPATEVASLTGPMPVVSSRSDRSMLRRPVTWLLLGAFAGQATGYYALSTWLPTILGDTLGVDRTAGGALASIFQGVGILGAFLVPLLTRFTPPLVPAMFIGACWLLVTGGMLLAPAAFVVWACFGAIAHAGGFVVIFSALVAVARTDREAAGMSALVQGSGYAVAALGAPVVGLLHEATGGWTVPLTVLLVIAATYCVLLVSAVVAVRRITRR